MSHLCTPVAATFSKDPEFWGHDFEPQTLVQGQGAYVIDATRRSYLDWVCGLGANLLGHNYPGFTQAVNEGLYKGLSFSLPNILEEEVACLIVDRIGSHIPGLATEELQVRFGATGSDVCSAAVRLARAVTGKNVILSYGYHGWHSEFVGATPPAWGCTPDQGYLRGLAWNDLRGLPEDAQDIAAIIIEQGVEEPDNQWYPGLRSWCNQHYALLILDEVVTGIRFGLGGAASRYNVHPDIVCLGKALGNGLPISALLAPRDLMAWFSRNDPVFALSSTTNANGASLAAARFILELWDYDKGRYLNQLGIRLWDGLWVQGWRVVGQPERFIIQWRSDQEHAYFVKQMCAAGILANRPFFGTLAHKDSDVALTLQATDTIMTALKTGEAEIPELPRVLFRNR